MIFCRVTHCEAGTQLRPPLLWVPGVGTTSFRHCLANKQSHLSHLPGTSRSDCKYSLRHIISRFEESLRTLIRSTAYRVLKRSSTLYTPATSIDNQFPTSIFPNDTPKRTISHHSIFNPRPNLLGVQSKLMNH